MFHCKRRYSDPLPGCNSNLWSTYYLHDILLVKLFSLLVYYKCSSSWNTAHLTLKTINHLPKYLSKIYIIHLIVVCKKKVSHVSKYILTNLKSMSQTGSWISSVSPLIHNDTYHKRTWIHLDLLFVWYKCSRALNKYLLNIHDEQI
jgi:hypothetical protein